MGCKQRFNASGRGWDAGNAVPVDFFETAARAMVTEMGWLR